MKELFTKAFAIWEDDFRANPEKYMTDAEVAAMEVLPLAEGRALCFEKILATLAA